MHWLLIILGTFIFSISLSNPFYKLVIGKRLKLKTFFQLILRIFVLIVGLIVIGLGLYYESL